jgi:hypothetical protein
MSSTYSPDLRIELIGAGEQAGTWNTTTNTNLGTLIEDAISGYISVSVTSANQAFTASNGVADQARNATIALTTTTAAAFAVYAPPASKQYIIYNTTAYVATVYNSTVLGNTTAAGLGVAVPAGKKVIMFSDGSNFRAIEATDLTGVLPVVNGGTGVTTSTGTGSTVLNNTPTLVTPILGTPTSGTLTSCTGLPVSSGISGLGSGVATFLATPSSANLRTAVSDETGTGSLVFATDPTITLANGTGLPVATGISGLGAGVATFLATPSSANLRTAVSDETGSGSLVFATSPTLVTPALGTPTSGTLTSCTGLPIDAGTTGTLPVLRGGTGVTTSTGSGNNVLSTSPTLVTPILGTPTSGALDNCTANTETFGNSSTQLATTAFVQAALAALHPVGSIYTSTSATNPGTALGFGTWVAFGAGRVMVGVGGSFSAGATGGSADAIVVSHDHSFSATTSTASLTGTFTASKPGTGTGIFSVDSTSVAGGADGSQSSATRYDVDASHSHTLSGTTGSAGASGTNANLQPYVVVYMWNRTA